MTVDAVIREAFLEVLRSPEGQEAIRTACAAATAPPVVTTIPFPARKMKVRDAALYANRHPDTIRRAIAAKKLRADKPAGSREWLIEPKDLQEWIAGETDQAGDVDIEAELGKSLKLARRSGK